MSADDHSVVQMPEAANRPVSLSSLAAYSMGRPGGVNGDAAAGLLAQERFEVVGIAGKRGGITVDMLRQHFHLPLNNVAHKFGMCSTAFKKMCRRLDIPKWPHRQLRGIDKKISGLKAELSTCTSSEERDAHLAELAGLQDDKAKLLRVPGGTDPDSGSESSRSSATGSTQSPSCKSVPAGAGERLVPALAQEQSESDEGSANEVDSVVEGSVDQEPLPVAGPTGSIVVTQRELRNNFHLPLNTVASKFCMCSTAFKKMCRRFGIAKWPHRKLRGIDKRIAALRAELKYAKDQEKVNYTKSLEALIQEKHRLTMGPIGEASEDAAGDAAHEWLISSEPQSMHNSPPPSRVESSCRRVQIQNLVCDNIEEDADDDDDDDEDNEDEKMKEVHPERCKLEGEGEEVAASAKGITEQVLREHYHLALHVVANKFGMCATAFKKLCRRFGIAKWPHRKLRGIDRKIAAFKAEIKYARQGDTTYHRGLARLEQEKALLCANASTSKPLVPLRPPPAARPSAPGLDVLASVVGMLPSDDGGSMVDSPPMVRPVLELTVGRPMMSRCGNDAACQKEQQAQSLNTQFDTPPLHPALGPKPTGAMQV